MVVNVTQKRFAFVCEILTERNGIMKRILMIYLSLFLVTVMLISTFVSCASKTPNTSLESQETQATSNNSTSTQTETEKQTDNESTTQGIESLDTETDENDTLIAESETTGAETSCTDTTQENIGTSGVETDPLNTETENTATETETEAATVTSDTETEDSEMTFETVNTETETSETEMCSSDTDEVSSETDKVETTLESETESASEFTAPDIEDGEVIANANNLWGNVNAYYESGTRKDFTIENRDMSLTVHASPDGNALIGSVKNSNGNSYIEDTMDVFVRMKDGKTFYASASQNPITFDLYRFGMYYYELRAQKQNFVNRYNVYAEKDLEVESVVFADNGRFYEMSKPTFKDGAVKTTMLDKNDPRIYYDHTSFSAEEYNYLAVDVKVTSPDISYMRSLTVFAWAESDSVNVASEVSQSVANDGEFHTYYFKLDSSSKYAGNINQFRFDFGGIIGDVLEYKNVRAVKADTDGSPDVTLCRYIHMFSDKAQQVIQISARKTTEGIEEIGVVTNIDADRVNAVIVKDKNGIHDTVDGVDWDSVEYVAFDIADAGIFGYILLPDGDLALMGTTKANDTSSGKIVVSEKDGKYEIIQSRAPANNRLVAPTGTDNPEIDNYTENFDNCADFYMGHRIYTDETHDFTAFIEAAEIERNPLGSDNITVDTENSTNAQFLGYDALRGMYVFKLDGSNFNQPFYEEPNKHFNVNFSVKGDTYNRNMYIMTTTEHGELQCAAILDANNMLLPIPVEVGKNFSDSGQNYFDAKDEPWSEAYFPMYINAGEEKTFNFLNLYMNWGRFPLKQISFIQLAPLYHLSTGVTETNCLLPWYSNMGSTRNIWTIPDHRPMSAPFWATQPNHTSGGDHRFLRYTDSEGNYSVTEVKKNYITSYGPTYAEVVFEHLSDDGKIRAKYTHMEMPQTDENRAYYTMEYEILEDVSFNSFKDDFIFYSMNAYNGVDYERVGYLDENNECKVIPADTRKGRPRYYVLGDNCPYFSFFRDSDNSLERGYVNLSFLIKNAEINLQAVEGTPAFVVKSLDRHLYLTFNLEEATLKKGDTIKINAIIMPWGSQESDYSLEDKNVRDVRENTIINALEAVPESGCTVIESDWLPKLWVTNGKTANFTLKGASGNSTVQLCGLTSLSVPMIYEWKDNVWVRYNISSQHYRDKRDNGQAYDGYAVQYNKDGTYSYSFVVDMSSGEDRLFKVVVADKFVEEPIPEFNPDDAIYDDPGMVEGPNLMLDPQALFDGASKTSANKAMNKNKSGVMKDADGTEYFRFFATNGESEAWIMPYTIPQKPIKTGKYLVMKYRLPSTNTVTTRFEIWTSTYASVPQAGQCFSYYKDYLSADDTWRILVIDLSQMPGVVFEAAPTGDYYANFLRFDFFDKGYGNDSYIDVAYIAFDDQASDIFAYPENLGFDQVTYYDGRVLDVLTTETDFPASKTIYEDDTTEYETPFDLYLSAKKLAHLGSNTTEFGNVSYYADGDYVRFNSHAFASECDFTIYRSEEGNETGRYLVIKYRASETQNSYMQFYATTLALYNETTNPEGKRYFDESNVVNFSNDKFIRNGEWQIAIVDLSKITAQYTEGEDGKFGATWVRFDVFNGKQGTTAEYVDVAYIAMCDDLSTAVKYDTSVETALVRLDSSTTERYSTETGEAVGNSQPPSVPDAPKPLLSLDPLAIATKANSGTSLGGATVSTDGKYVTVSNSQGVNNGFFFVVSDGNAAIGQYIMIKYRTENADRWEWYVRTKGQSYGIFYVEPICDGEWHTVVIDLSASPDGSYVADANDGKYYGNAIRWAIMRTARDYDVTVDVEFIAVSDNLESLAEANSKDPYIIYSSFDNDKIAVAENDLLA